MTFFPPNFDWTYTRHPLGGIYVSDDHGEHWTQIEANHPISGVIQIAYNPLNPQLVYAATGGTGLLKSTDGGTNWQNVPSWPGSPNIRSFAIHPRDPDRIYVSASDSVYVSTDAGASWTDLHLDPNEYRRLFFAPTEPAELYAGGCCGLKRSLDGQTWERVDGVPLGASVHALAAGKDAQRAVVYIGMSGGMTSIEAHEDGGSKTAEGVWDVVPGLGSVMGGGVYRFTTLLPSRWVYLPLVVRAD